MRCLLAAALMIAAAAPTPDPAESVIWSGEHAIYAGRAAGSVQPYLDQTSPNFLAWPAGMSRLVDRTGLAGEARSVAGGHEVIHSELTGFARDGDTAVVYYVNHRTVRPDGTHVDERYANIHVWIRRSGKWLVLGGMSRPIAP